uniref:Uncharacterized protein n=2 Tax=Aegilops tauschii subsp. strangulata TaxID=200361 RepID=A0A453C4D8_AEGTS
YPLPSLLTLTSRARVVPLFFLYPKRDTPKANKNSRHNRQPGFPPRPPSPRRRFFEEPPPTPPPSPLSPRVVDTHGVTAHPPRVREGVAAAVPLLGCRCRCRCCSDA